MRGRPGIDIDGTDYGHASPACGASLAHVPQARSCAPLAFAFCGWSTALASLAAIATGDVAAIGLALGAMTGAAASLRAIHRSR
jgi:hypothetical protein